MKKRLLILVLAPLLLLAPALAQRVAVTGIVEDANGSLYSNCTGSAIFIGQNTSPGGGPYLLNGSVFQTQMPIYCNSVGAFSLTLADNNVVSPTPSQWNFSICSAQGYLAGPFCFNTLITITGTSQSVTTTLQAVAPLLPGGSTPSPGGVTGQIQARGANNTLVGTSPIYANLVTGTGNNDIGDKVNTAQALSACPAGGCRIFIAPTASCQNYTTPIVLSKATLYGDPAGGSCIDFTPSSGTALAVDPGTSTHPFGIGVRDLTIEGACTNSGNVPVCSGVTSVGLSLGPTNGLEGGFFENLRLGLRGAGFLNGILIGNAFNNTFINVMAYGNSVGWNQPVGTEANQFFGGSLSQNIHGLSIAGTGPELYIFGTHFDDNTTCAIDGNSSNYILHLFSPHFENVGGGTNCYASLTGAGGRFLITGGQAYDHLGGSAMFTFDGNQVASWGLTEYNSGSTSAVAWNLTNNSSSMADLENIDISLGGTITAEYNSAYTGRRWTRDMNPSANPAPVSMGEYYLQPTQISQFTSLTLPTGGFINLPDNSLLATWEDHAGSGTCGLSKDASDRLTWSGSGCTILFPATSFNAQVTSTVSTGTAPLVIASTTPVANLAASPTTYNHSGTQLTATHIVSDTCTLGTSCSVTLTGSAVFTGSTTYSCSGFDTTAKAAIQFVPSSGSAFALTGTGTDVLSYTCVGY